MGPPSRSARPLSRERHRLRDLYHLSTRTCPASASAQRIPASQATTMLWNPLAGPDLLPNPYRG